MATGAQPARAHNDQVLEVFARVARRPMIKAWGKNCCIHATRTAILVLDYFGIAAEPFPCKLCVEDPAQNVAKLIGFTERERRDIFARSQPHFLVDQTIPHQGWPGHLVAVVNRRVLLDASFDQAAAPEHALVIPEHVLMIPIPESFTHGDQMVEVIGTIDDGPPLHVRYWPSQDLSFKLTDAWFAPDCHIIAAEVAWMVRQELQQKEPANEQ